MTLHCPVCGVVSLSKRQRQVLMLASNGYTANEIAHYLEIGYETVKYHLSRIRQQFNVTTTAAAVAIALSEGIIE